MNNRVQLGIATDQYGNKSIANYVIAENSNTNLKEKIFVLWDTGSNVSHITKNIEEKLNLKTIGRRNCSTMTENFHFNIVNINIKFEDIPSTINISPSVKSDLNGYDGVIGMDIISKGKLVIDCSENGDNAFYF